MKWVRRWLLAVSTRLLGRLPIGVLQLLNNKVRLLAAISGVSFALVLVFLQLGLAGAMMESVAVPYRLFHGDLLLVSSSDAHTLFGGERVPRRRLFEALAHPDVEDGIGLYTSSVSWNRDSGESNRLQVIAVDPTADGFLTGLVNEQRSLLTTADTALLDRKTRFRDMSPHLGASPSTPAEVELNNRQIHGVGLFQVGGGFAGDGGLFVSDQTFFHLFPNRTSAAPNHVLLRLAPGADGQRVSEALTQRLDGIQVRSVADASDDEQFYQMTERPVGLVFAMGVFIGLLVGIVISYQVLSTDVADHLDEYATFKAMGYAQPFFVGVILEEALFLAAIGFWPGLGGAHLVYVALSASAGLPIFMTTTRAVSVFVGTLLACALSGILAIRKLAAADPADLF